MFIENGTTNTQKPQRGDMFIENGTTKRLKAPEGRHVYRKRDNQMS